ncbi:odorant receptor 4-like [Chrysoperla carnea]|uniref:odorant receptor 4-like n=1 Tax=Chrysoperla carnea TaxID=189513 RepID=UPI001D06D1F5|nr:odorant receptor 4-like [Chrysoperla carnea]
MVVTTRCASAAYSSTRSTPVLIESTNINATINNIIYEKYKILPYKSWAPCNKTISPCFEYTFVIQAIGLYLYGYYIALVDIIIIGVLVHLRAQLIILNRSLTTVIQRTHNAIKKHRDQLKDIEISSAIFKKTLNNKLSECIDHHQLIIDLTDEMEAEFNILILFQFFGSLLLVCLCMFQMSINPLNSPAYPSVPLYLTWVLYQLFIYCYFGQEISTESELIAEAAYNCEWIGTEHKVQTSLMLLINRSQRPLYLTAGKFSKLSLETYASIIRGGGSYYAVLSRVNE